MSSAGRSRKPLVQAGDVVRVPEAHYLYGSDVLTMRVTGVGADLEKYPSLEWVGLKGVEIRWDGSDGDEREALVRVAALREWPPVPGDKRDPSCDNGATNGE
jgi:hypothetical protein